MPYNPWSSQPRPRTSTYSTVVNSLSPVSILTFLCYMQILPKQSQHSLQNACLSTFQPSSTPISTTANANPQEKKAMRAAELLVCISISIILGAHTGNTISHLNLFLSPLFQFFWGLSTPFMFFITSEADFSKAWLRGQPWHVDRLFVAHSTTIDTINVLYLKVIQG